MRHVARGKILAGMPSVLEFASRIEEHVKGMIVPSTLFEELGFNYIGPIDGHDLDSLIPTLQNLRQLEGPQFLHIITKKAKVISSRKSTGALPRGWQIQCRSRHLLIQNNGETDLHPNLQ